MNITSVNDAAPIELEKSVSYGCYCIRLAWRDGVPFFVAEDIIVALRMTIGPKATVASRISSLREGTSRSTTVLDGPDGPTAYDIISAHGAQQLCKSRKGKTAQSVGRFLSSQAARLTPKKPKVPKASDERPDGPRPLNGQHVRFVTINGLPWLSAADYVSALVLPLARTLRDLVPAAHRSTAMLPSAAGGTEEGPVISPIGAWQLALRTTGRLRMMATMWVYAETKAIEPDAFERGIHGPAQMMALLPSGDVPPRPHLQSGRVPEWEELRNRDAHLAYRYNRPTAVQHLRELQAQRDAMTAETPEK